MGPCWNLWGSRALSSLERPGLPIHFLGCRQQASLVSFRFPIIGFTGTSMDSRIRGGSTEQMRTGEGAHAHYIFQGVLSYLKGRLF